LKKDESLMLDEAARFGRSMELLVNGSQYEVEVDYALRMVFIHRKSSKTVQVPFENLRFIVADAPEISPTRAREGK
jgi:hypothetical protein